MRNLLWLALVVPLTQTACFVTISGQQLEAISPAAPGEKFSVEQTVGDFSFTLDGGKMITSNKAGRTLNDEILKRWKRDGYISDYRYVPSSQFSEGARHRLTLSGSQYGESSILLQILSGASLYVIPHKIDTKYDVQFTFEDAATGRKYSAAVRDNTVVWWELLLLVALPVSMNGANATFDVMADHLYDQLREQGAFDVVAAPAADPAVTAPEGARPDEREPELSPQPAQPQ